METQLLITYLLTYLLSQKRGHGPQFSAHVYCGQTVAHLSYCWALVFTLVNLHCFTIQQSIQYCSNPTIKQQIEVLVRLMWAMNLSIISWFKMPLWLQKMVPCCRQAFISVKTASVVRWHWQVLGVVILSVCPSVRLSVCHTRALWLMQRTYRRHFYTTWKGNPSSFLVPKISAKFQQGHPRRGRLTEVGVG